MIAPSNNGVILSFKAVADKETHYEIVYADPKFSATRLSAHRERVILHVKIRMINRAVA